MPPPSTGGQGSTGPTPATTQSARWAALPARKKALFVVAGFVALVGLLVWGSFAEEEGGDSGGGGDNPTLSEAFCNDVKAGASPYQMFASVPDRWDDMSDFADNAYGMMAISCSSELEGWRWFFEEYNINIDA